MPMNVRLSVRMCVHTFIRDPVRLRLRHLYQVEFCCFIVRYPTAGASVYCGHISSFLRNKSNISTFWLKERYLIWTFGTAAE